MQVVYVVTEGWYSEHRVAGVFSTRENAQQYIQDRVQESVQRRLRWQEENNTRTESKEQMTARFRDHYDIQTREVDREL